MTVRLADLEVFGDVRDFVELGRSDAFEFSATVVSSLVIGGMNHQPRPINNTTPTAPATSFAFRERRMCTLARPFLLLRDELPEERDRRRLLAAPSVALDRESGSVSDPSSLQPAVAPLSPERDVGRTTVA